MPTAATLPTAQLMLATYVQAEAKVLSGQSVRMGDRQLNRADLAEIRKGRQEWEAKVRAEQRRGCGLGALADFGGRT